MTSSVVSRLICHGYSDLGIPPLYLHTLTGTPDAERILSKPAFVHPESQNIIPRLQQLAPALAPSFSPKNDRKSNIPFKLITTDRVWTSERTTSFLAVSYCWQAADWNAVDRLFNGIDCKDWVLPISPAMLKSVLDLKESESQGIWIDQLCIDQDNRTEKTHAIASMDTIYRNASQLIVLLEDVNISFEEARILQGLGSYHASSQEDTSHLDKDNSTTLYLKWKYLANAFGRFPHDKLHIIPRVIEQFFSARWFKRAWCSHEYQLNSDRNFLIAAHNNKCLVLTPEFIRILLVQHKKLAPYSLSRKLRWTRGAYTFLLGIGTNKPSRVADCSLLQIFYNIARLDVSHLEDKVSVALNVTGLSIAFDGSLNTEVDCQWHLLILALAGNDASVLGIDAASLVDNCGNKSWLQWPDDSGTLMQWSPFSSDRMPRLTRQHLLREINFFGICLDLIHFKDSILPPSENAMRKAASFFLDYMHRSQNHGLYPYISYQISTIIETMDSISMEELFQLLTDLGIPGSLGRQVVQHIEYLACGLDCGSTWMLSALTAMGETFNRYNERRSNLEDKGPDPWPQAQDHLFPIDDEIIFEDVEVKNRLRNFLLIALWGQRRLYVSLGLTPYRLPVGPPDNFGICLLPLRVDMHNPNDPLLLTLPMPLNSTEAIGTKRLWILRKNKDDPSSYHLVGKGYLFGCGELFCDNQNITYIPNARIVARPPRKASKKDITDKADFPSEKDVTVGA